MNKDVNERFKKVMIWVNFWLIVIVCIFMAAYTELNNTFDPNKDVCLIFEHNISRENCIFYKDQQDICYINPEIKIWVNDNTLLGSTYKCDSWRPKNKCDLDPEAEGCICDEWKTDWVTIYDTCTIHKGSVVNCLVEENKTCIKAHEPVCKEVCWTEVWTKGTQELERQKCKEVCE